MVGVSKCNVSRKQKSSLVERDGGGVEVNNVGIRGKYRHPLSLCRLTLLLGKRKSIAFSPQQLALNMSKRPRGKRLSKLVGDR